MRCRIYHSTEFGHRFSKWGPEAPLKLVDDYELPLPADALDQIKSVPITLLELIYRDQNAVDGHERNVKMRNRSLSVGDVVVLGERAYAVASIGFEEIEPDRMKVMA